MEDDNKTLRIPEDGDDASDAGSVCESEAKANDGLKKSSEGRSPRVVARNSRNPPKRNTPTPPDGGHTGALPQAPSKVQLVGFVERAKEAVESVEQALVLPDSLLLGTAVGLARQEEISDVGDALLKLFCARKMGQRLILWQVRRELAAPGVEPESLFRGHSFAARFMSVLLRVRCLDWLQRLLQPIVLALCLRNVNLEVDPRRLRSGENPVDMMANKRQLIQYVDRFVADVVTAVELFPQPVKALFHSLQLAINQRFDGMGPTIIGSFFFLRFVCAALVTPREYELVKNPPSAGALRSLVLLSKVLQNISNQVSFGEKETYLQFMNPHLQRHFDKISRCLGRLSILPDSKSADHIDLSVAPEERVLQLRTLSLFLHRRRSAFAQTLEAEAETADAADVVDAAKVEAWVYNALPPKDELEAEAEERRKAAEAAENARAEAARAEAARAEEKEADIVISNPVPVSGPKRMVDGSSSNALGPAGARPGPAAGARSGPGASGSFRRNRRGTELSDGDQVTLLKATLEDESKRRREAEAQVEALRGQVQLLMQKLQQERNERYAAMRELRELREAHGIAPDAPVAAAADAAAPSASSASMPLVSLEEAKSRLSADAPNRLAQSTPVAPQVRASRSATADPTRPHGLVRSSTASGTSDDAKQDRSRASSLAVSVDSSGAAEDEGEEVQPTERANPGFNLRPVMRRTTSQKNNRQTELLPKVQLRKVDAATPAAPAPRRPPSKSAASSPAKPDPAASVAEPASPDDEDKGYGLSAFRRRLSRFQSTAASGAHTMRRRRDKVMSDDDPVPGPLETQQSRDVLDRPASESSPSPSNAPGSPVPTKKSSPERDQVPRDNGSPKSSPRRSGRKTGSMRVPSRTSSRPSVSEQNPTEPEPSNPEPPPKPEISPEAPKSKELPPIPTQSPENVEEKDEKVEDEVEEKFDVEVEKKNDDYDDEASRKHSSKGGDERKKDKKKKDKKDSGKKDGKKERKKKLKE